MFLKNYKAEYLKNDLIAGMIVALVSIPIAIGYALVSGLPPVYGLYGSLLPILIYGFMTTSPRFVFGIDAAPAALVGGMVYNMGITLASEEAMKVIPVITLVTACWLLVFRLVGMGKFVKFISSPVMGGFISGIGCTIILMQVPKLFGGTAGRGEITELAGHIINEIGKGMNTCSLILGAGTIAVILISKKYIPKVPMIVIMMFAGAGMTAVFHVERYGVKLLPAVKPGLPSFELPDLSVLNGHFSFVLVSSLTVALVILAETLLATNNFAVRNDDRIDNNREILACAMANFAAAFTGCCPANGSVSRTGIAAQFGVRTQMMSVTAALTMLVILEFGTGFIAYLPIPVLTGIVIAALIGILEFDLSRKLRNVDRTEWRIFWAVFLTVLIFGTVYGVLAGIILSFVTVIIRASDPPRAFIGYISEIDGFYPIGRMRAARAIENVVIYKFSGTLFFANTGQFQLDIEDAVAEDTKVVIVDAGAVGGIDITAAERLLMLYDKMKSRGIKFFFTEHTGEINDQLREFGAERMFEDGAIRSSVEAALDSAGIKKPYRLAADGGSNESAESLTGMAGSDMHMAEFEWAYGADADLKMREFASEMAEKIVEDDDFDTSTMIDTEREVFGSNWSRVDEEKFLDILEMQMALIAKRRRISESRRKKLEDRILTYHARLDSVISERDNESFRKIVERRMDIEEDFRRRYPETYEAFVRERQTHREILEKENPEILERIYSVRGSKKSRADAGRSGRRKAAGRRMSVRRGDHAVDDAVEFVNSILKKKK